MKYLIIALVVAWGVGLILIPLTIPLLKRLKFGQNIRVDGPQQHLKKSGTPTMGGIAFIAILIVSMLFLGDFNRTAFWAIGITVLYGVLGFLDVFIKT